MSVPWYLMAKGKGGGGYKTASGPIVSVNDALAAPLRSLLVNIDPVQEGTGDPSPDNVRPISGWSECKVWRTGKNLCDSAVGRYLWANGARYVNTAGAYCATENKFEIVGGQSYIVSFVNTAITQSVAMAFFAGDTYISAQSKYAEPYVFEAPETATKAAINIRNSEDYTGNPTVSNLQLELGSTPTPYAPYSGNQYTLQLGQTVYGGTLDVTAGKMVVSHVVVKFGNWMKGLISDYSSKNGYYYNGANLTPPMASGSFYSDPDTICSHFAKKSNADSGMGIWIGANSTYFYFAHVKENIPNIETSAKFCEWLEANDVFMTYPLATPITIPLTPQEISTLQGQNNVWADSGDVTVEYLASGGANPDLMKLAVAFMGRK